MTAANLDLSDRPWRKAFPDVADWNGAIEPGTLPDLLDRAASSFADRPAIEFRDRQVTYRALAEKANRVAAGLLACGIGKGDTVGLYLPNTPWQPIVLFAVARTGARIVLLSALDARKELAYKLRDSGARTLVSTNISGVLPTALRLLDEGAVDRLFVGEDAIWRGEMSIPTPFSDKVQTIPESDPPLSWPEIRPADGCLLQYTGGTTGLPKAAILTHGNLTSAVAIYRLWRDGVTVEEAPERALMVLPLFHIYALTMGLRHLAEGDELMLRVRFDVETLLDDIGRKRATVFAGVPTMWIALLNHPKAASCDFSSLRSCISGGAPMPFEVEQKVTRLIGRRLTGGWGMTETCPAGTRIPNAAPPAPGLIGAPLPGIDMRIVGRNDPARGLPPGEPGEIAIRGPNVFGGYWNRPEETAASFHDGWFLTGDIGKMDEQGLFYILDRKKNMIISGGFNVYPAAVENAIHEHPDVVEVAVIGVPDPYRGQSAKAFVTLRAGAAPLTLEDLKIFLADRLGKHEMPAALELRQSLPRSAAGKLLARILVEEELAKTDAAGDPKKSEEENQ
jgi:long-chain acyl-CoA synthetase